MRLAEADLGLARVPLPERGLHEYLCYHAQQAVEKSLKAVLVEKGVEFPYTHNIQRLIDLLPEQIPRIDVFSSAARLTAYAVTTRYPSEEEPVGETEYREALRVEALAAVKAASQLQWYRDIHYYRARGSAACA